MRPALGRENPSDESWLAQVFEEDVLKNVLTTLDSVVQMYRTVCVAVATGFPREGFGQGFYGASLLVLCHAWCLPLRSAGEKVRAFTPRYVMQTCCVKAMFAEKEGI